MTQHAYKDTTTAIEAKDLAQWIAFGPVIFQAARVLRDTGILQAIEDSGSNGMTLAELVEKIGLSEYGIRVLLEAGLGMKLVYQRDDHYFIGKTGYFILHDDLTRVNMNFVHDVCYKGMYHLDESIETGRPAGLPTLGNWHTIYEGLSQLPAHIQKSWFEFDHFFSDIAFGKVLQLVLEAAPKKIMDIGGNTGKWALAATAKDPHLEVTIVDLPGQLEMAKKNIKKAGREARVQFCPVNILDESQEFPKGHDTIL